VFRAQILVVLAVSAYIQLQGGKDTRKPGRALASDEIKLSDLYDKQSGIYFEPVFADLPKPPQADSSDGPGRKIRVAILDTGVLHAHPSLKGVKILDKDFTGEGTEDQNGHGTVMTLLYLEVTRSLTNQEILNVKVLGKDGSGDPDDIKNGMQWAVDNGAEILNMSLGVPASLFQDVCTLASKLSKEKGVHIVAAAGNDPGIPMCPASAEGVISVGATNRKPPMEPSVFAPGTNTFTPVLPAPSVQQESKCSGDSWRPTYDAALAQGNSEEIINLFRTCPETAEAIFKQLTSDSSSANLANDCDRSLKIAGIQFQIANGGPNTEHEVIALNRVGVGFTCRGDFAKATFVLNKALELSKRLPDRTGEENTLVNLADVKQRNGDFAGAVDILTESLELARLPQVNDQESEAGILGNLCSAYVSLKKFTEATANCNEALRQASEQNDPYLKGRTLLNLGTLYFDEKQLEKARKYFQEARNVCISEIDLPCIQISQRELGKVNVELGQN